MTSTRAHKAKLTLDFLAFPSVKFLKIWQTGSEYFTLVGARLFMDDLQNQVFSHKFAKIENNCFYKPYFFVFIIRIRHNAMCCKNFEDFTDGKIFKKITNKVIKDKNHICLGFYNPRLKLFNFYLLHVTSLRGLGIAPTYRLKTLAHAAP